MTKLHKVFVYGTLRPGNTPTVEVPGKMYDLGWFPGAKVNDSSDETFVCEVVEVDDATLAQLDRYEGYDPENERGSLYIRHPWKDGWIYEYNGIVHENDRVNSGDWLVYKDHKAGLNARLAQRQPEGVE